MHTLVHRLPALFVLGALAAAATAARAEDAAAANAGMRSASAGLQGDARNNRALQTTLSLPVGQRNWVSVGGGQTRNAQDAVAHSPKVFTAGAGYFGAGWRAAVAATQRSDGQAFRQTDVAAALDWQGETFDVGLDGSTRNARQQGTVSAPNGQGGTAAVPVAQTIKGGGVGLRGGVKLGADTRLYAGVTRYDYTVLTQQNGASNGSSSLVGGLLGNRTLLARTLSTRDSAVNRDETALSRSVQLGATYRFEHAALTAEYTGDQVLDTPGTAHTALLKAAIALGPHWTVAPAIGRTRSDVIGGVNFAGLSASYAW